MERKTFIVKMSVFANVVYRFNAISIRTIVSFLVHINKPILKFMWRGKRSRVTNTILKENKIGGPTLLSFKTYCKAIIIKAVCHW